MDQQTMFARKELNVGEGGENDRSLAMDHIGELRASK